jgi:nucleoside-diphosphate-sugar epimerase
VSLNLSITPGQPDRSVHVRGSAAVARLDFERDVYWREQARSNSAMFDPLHVARASARQIRSQGWRNVRRQLGRHLLARPPLDRVPGQHLEQRRRVLPDVSRHARAQARGPLRRRSDPTVRADRCCRRCRARGTAEADPDRRRRSLAQALGARRRRLAGFIGKRLVRSLVERGIGVRVLSRSVASARLAFSGLPVDVVQGTHDDRQVLDRALDGIAVVYHLAKATGQRWDDYVSNDIEPTRVLAEAALAHRVSRFIYTGTIDSYDSADARTVIDSSTPVDACMAHRNLYARSKAACEAILQRMHAERGLPLVIFRPGVVIGEGSPPAHWGVGMFHSDTRAQLWGSGTTKLPLVLVDDVAEGLALGMEVPGIEGRSFLLTDAPLLTAREYVAEVAAASATRISAPPTPIWRFFALDVAKEAVKHLIRHRNRRVPSYRDWSCRAHRARYDSSETQRVLGWKPAATREAMVERGIVAAVRHYFA